MAEPYRIYGHLDSRDVVALSLVLHAKGLAFDRVEETPSLSWVLAERSGHDSGPYLRTPAGFLLGDLHAILDWIERTHPDPALLPRTPVRHLCARLLEDWIELWLPLWPGRSWQPLEHLGAHLARTGFLLGSSPTRPDWLLASWLEADVLTKTEETRVHLAEHAPRLLTLAEDLFSVSLPADGDDAIPISLLAILEEIAQDYHRYLVANQEALKDGEDSVSIDRGLGFRKGPVRPVCEARRMEIAEALRAMPHEARQDVRRVLEPVGAWHVLTLPAVLRALDPSDPRSI